MQKDEKDWARFRAIISGLVQMVGYRAFTETRAESHGLQGCVRNLVGGSVEVVAEGPRKDLETFLTELKKGPSGARVKQVLVDWERPRGEFDDFRIEYGAW